MWEMAVHAKDLGVLCWSKGSIENLGMEAGKAGALLVGRENTP